MYFLKISLIIGPLTNILPTTEAETLRIVSLVNGLRDVCSDRAEYLQTLQEDQLEIGAEIQRVPRPRTNYLGLGH